MLIVVAILVPLAGLALLLGVPSLDLRWEHHPSHFWLVLGVAVLNVALGAAVSEAARNGRTFACSWSRWYCSRAPDSWPCTRSPPGVVLAGPNGGFSLATPIGLLIASGFAAVSALDLEAHEATLLRLQRPIRIGLLIVLLAWAVASSSRSGS